MKLQRYNELLFAVVATGALLAALAAIVSAFWPSRHQDLAGVFTPALPG